MSEPEATAQTAAPAPCQGEDDVSCHSDLGRNGGEESRLQYKTPIALRKKGFSSVADDARSSKG